jgi:hypothetical protein
MGVAVGCRISVPTSARHVQDLRKIAENLFFKASKVKKKTNHGYTLKERRVEVETFRYKDGQELFALFSHFNSRYNCIRQCQRPLHCADVLIEDFSNSADTRSSPCIRVNQSMERQDISATHHALRLSLHRRSYRPHT